MPLAGKHPNGIPDTGAADSEHKYESATTQPCDLALASVTTCRIIATARKRDADQIVLEPVLRSNVVMATVVFSHQPIAPLRPFIEKLWYCEEYQAAHRKERVLPSGRFQLIIHLADTFALQQDFVPG